MELIKEIKQLIGRFTDWKSDLINLIVVDNIVLLTAKALREKIGYGLTVPLPDDQTKRNEQRIVIKACEADVLYALRMIAEERSEIFCGNIFKSSFHNPPNQDLFLKQAMIYKEDGEPFFSFTPIKKIKK